MGDIAYLACGEFSIYREYKSIYDTISQNIDKIENNLKTLNENSDENMSVIGPFLGRMLLESVFTALVGRLDPFRIIFVKNVQQCDSFGLGKQSNSAIRWFGDIFEQGLQPSEKENNKMWKPDKKFNTIGRGLLGDYYGEVFWKLAFQDILDNRDQYSEIEFLDNYSRTPPEGFISRVRQEASRLYSSLSKGVHSELVINSDIIYDRSTVNSLIGDTIKLCGILSLVSHNIDTSLCHIEINRAVEIYIKIMEMGENYGE